MSFIPLLSSDLIPFSISRAAANCSGLLQCMIEDEDADITEPIPILGVDGTILQKIIEFCEHHVQDPMPEIKKPIPSGEFQTLVNSWYDSYVDIPHTTLFPLVEAANYMDIKPLMDLACAKIAHMIKDKSVEQIRETFHLPNDFTPEEEAAFREELRWCEEEA